MLSIPTISRQLCIYEYNITNDQKQQLFVCVNWPSVVSLQVDVNRAKYYQITASFTKSLLYPELFNSNPPTTRPSPDRPSDCHLLCLASASTHREGRRETLLLNTRLFRYSRQTQETIVVNYCRSRQLGRKSLI